MNKQAGAEERANRTTAPPKQQRKRGARYQVPGTSYQVPGIGSIAGQSLYSCDITAVKIATGTYEAPCGENYHQTSTKCCAQITAGSREAKPKPKPKTNDVELRRTSYDTRRDGRKPSCAAAVVVHAHTMCTRISIPLCPKM